MARVEQARREMVDVQDAAWQIADLLRASVGFSDTLVHQVGISALAWMLKNAQGNEAIYDSLPDVIEDEATRRFLVRLSKEYGEQISLISSRYDADTLKSVTLSAEPRLFRDGDDHSTPQGISQLALSLLDLKPDDVVLDLGSGVGSFLIEAGKRFDNMALYGVELNVDSLKIAHIRSFVSGIPMQLICGDMVSQDYSKLSANKVFSNFPVGFRFPRLQRSVEENGILKNYLRGIKRTASGDWIFGLAAYLNMKKPGRTVLLMSNAGTWNQSDEPIRKQLLESGAVEGAIQLPGNLFSYTKIAFTMLILSQNNSFVRMVDASNIFTEERRRNYLETDDIRKIVHAYRNDSEISRDVGLDEIAQQEYIVNPVRYIETGLEITNGIELGQVCTSINRGAMIRSAELDELVTEGETGFRYLALQHIEDGVIDAALPSLTHLEERYQKHCIKDGNLVISRNAPFKVALAKIPEGREILAHSNLYFLELDESSVNPLFVSVFLQSEVGMAQLNSLSKGTVVRSISIQDLKRVQIPNLPREQQDRIAEEYQNLSDDLIVLQRQADLIRDKRSRLLEGVV